MSEQSDDSDKQHEPSAKKLEDARKKGEIARSADLNTAGSYAGMLLVMVAFAPPSLLSLIGTLQILLGQADDLGALFFAGAAPQHGGLLLALASSLGIWFLAPAAFALFSVLLQRALLFTPSKIVPKWDRISPISGIKNKFGAQGLFEFAKSSAKLVIYCTVLGLFLVFQIEDLIGSAMLAPKQILVLLGRMLIGLLAIILLIAVCLGGIDYLWQYSHHLKKNRMSRQEMMDELKQFEGDPMMKQQRRQRGQEIATNRMLADVPKADVVIVNPTHFAVALQWDGGRGAPVCLAKGVDETAMRIRETAQDAGVPIHSDPPAARALFAEVAIGEEIQPYHYKAVAAAIRFAEMVRKKARQF